MGMAHRPSEQLRGRSEAGVPPTTTDPALPSTEAPNHNPRVSDRSDRVCVIGAGTSGLVAIKRLREAGYRVDCIEREPDLGGNWNIALGTSRVIESTHLISSKRLTEYLDHPMPAEWPEYPSHRLVLSYLRGYAERFALTDAIEFGVAVQRVTPYGSGANDGWVVELASGDTRRYARLIIANGHNHDFSFPEWSGRTAPGPFDGVEIHSGEYTTPDSVAGKRVLVVGGGNSGCDIAAEASQHAATTRLSLRRGYHFLPKFYRGLPTDSVGERLLRWRVPLWARRRLALAMSYVVLGPRAGTGLPAPDHRLFETHPTINSRLVEQLRHGDLEVRPDVAELTRDGVRYADGREEPFDVIVYATGYRLTFPFIDPAHAEFWRDGRPAIVPATPSIRNGTTCSWLGLIQPDSGQWGLVDRQARVVARVLEAWAQDRPAAAAFAKRKRAPRPASSVRYLDTPRHVVEVEHFSYARALDREWKRLGRVRRGATQR